MKRIILASLVFTVTTAGIAGAAGFNIAEQGAKAMGMANAFVAQADDPSAVYYNPAGISFLQGTQVTAGVTVIKVPETTFAGSIDGGAPTTTKAREDIFTPPNFYITSTSDSGPLSFGFGINSQYPLAKRWPANTPFKAVVKELAIKPVNFNPTASVKVGDKLSLAAGLDYTHATVWLEKAFGANTLEMEGTGDGWGYNAGLLYKPTDSVSVGLSYRSKITLDISGDAVISAIPNSAYGVNTTITLPDVWKLGIAFKPAKPLTLEADIDRFGWSSYKRLDLGFTPGLPGVLPAPGITRSNSPKNWKDSWTYRLGCQYAASENLDLRAGIAYDKSPQPYASVGPELPDADRMDYTVGFGWHKGNGFIDVAYMYVDFKDRTVSNTMANSISNGTITVPANHTQSGTYKSEAHLVGFNVGYRF